MLTAVGAQATREQGSACAHRDLACAVLTVAVVPGRAVGGGFSDEVLAVALGFAGGAVLVSLADTLMPEASSTVDR